MDESNKRIPTAEVLVELMSAESFQEFYAENVDLLQLPALTEYLADLCREKDILPNKLFHDIDIEKSLGNKILSGSRRLSRDNALKIALGLKMGFKEAQRLLSISKNSLLYPFIPRDAAIIYCLHNKTGYLETQNNLFEWGMMVLGDSKSHEK